MSEGSERDLQIEAVIEAMSSLWDKDAHDVPEWVAQEITFSQMRLLFLLSRNGPAPMSRIAEWLGVGLPTASGTVERVERHGLVARQHRLDDRRVVECGLTEAGRHLIDEISGTRLEMMRQVLGVLNEEELAQMADLITAMVERVMPRKA
jgi:DNA-binding MarR family transcriptional regulator